MQEIQEIFDSITSKRQLQQIHIETVIDIYLDNEDIDPDELFKEIERFSKKIKEPYAILKKKFEKFNQLYIWIIWLETRKIYMVTRKIHRAFNK